MRNRSIKYAEIALPIPVDQTFTYHIPYELCESLNIGARVLVPFGPRRLTGYVISVSDTTSLTRVKPILDVLDEQPIVSSELMRLARWISEYYLCPLGEAIRATVPAGTNLESKILISLNKSRSHIREYSSYMKSGHQKRVLEILLESEKLTMQQLRKKKGVTNPGFAVNQLEKLGLLRREVVLSSLKAKPKLEKWVRLTKKIAADSEFEIVLEELSVKAPKQSLCLEVIRKHGDVRQRDVLKSAATGQSTIKALIDKGLVQQFTKETIREYYSAMNNIQLKDIHLNEYQKKALHDIDQAIHTGLFHPFLLYGVTGSGKTQVYIEALRRTLSKGKTAIVLVPEISLTPQTVSRFTANFPGTVAVLHSRMSTGERYDSWRKLKQGALKIAIGPRSAIFAPLSNIGLIVVDEEHESSYKQMDNVPYYNARDVALVRGKLNEAVVILGSATPSIESYYNAKIGKYHLLELPTRIDDIPMPSVRILDLSKMNRRVTRDKAMILTRPFEDKIAEKLKAQQQIILLQNRRGFSPYIQCKDCSFIEKCINCNITLTYHKTSHRLRCHYCNYIKKAPVVCPKCGGYDIIFQGVGTQRVENELRNRFPDAKIVRMDLDTTAQKWSHDHILQDFERKKYDILLGTQMIAKGHDFPDVTFVGVVSSDTALMLPDFRASERTFQLLTQVAGRAGRKDFQGEVIIQTYVPENYGIVCARTHDFKKFFSIEIQSRRELKYPPFSRLIQVLVKGEVENEVISAIQAIRSHFSGNDSLYEILGPVAAPISKIQNLYRWHFILKVDKKQDPSNKHINQIWREVRAKSKKILYKEGIKISINVDSLSLL
ncbi:primosomal protein N' [candidate division KSB1 bacterium]|nr:primosomal protein N' [candidate division KSB1 bacterium]